MAETASPPKSNRTKLIMIPILGAVLLYLVFTPGEQSETPTLVARPAAPVTSTNAPPPSPPVALTTVSPPPVATEKSGRAVIWPSVPLEKVMAINPFKQLPGLKSPPAELVDQSPPGDIDATLADRNAERAAELRAATKTYRVTALVQTSKGVGAMIGDQVVVVGDVLGDRVRVSAIRAEGIVLELIDRPATSEITAPLPEIR